MPSQLPAKGLRACCCVSVSSDQVGRDAAGFPVTTNACFWLAGAGAFAPASDLPEPLTAEVTVPGAMAVTGETACGVSGDCAHAGTVIVKQAQINIA